MTPSRITSRNASAFWYPEGNEVVVILIRFMRGRRLHGPWNGSIDPADGDADRRSLTIRKKKDKRDNVISALP